MSSLVASGVVMMKFSQDGQVFPTTSVLAWLSAWQGWLKTLPPHLAKMLCKTSQFVEDCQLALLEAHGASLLKQPYGYSIYEEGAWGYDEFMDALTEELETCLDDFVEYFLTEGSEIGLENDRFMEPVIVFGEVLEKRYPLRVVKQLVRFPEMVRHKIVEGQCKSVSDMRRWYLSQTEAAQSKKRRAESTAQTPDSLPPVLENQCAETEADTESQPVIHLD